MTDEPGTIYDLRGLKCPLPVLKTRKRLGEIDAGATLWIETTDPLAVVDIPHFCRKHGHVLLDTQVVEDGHRFLIRRSA